MHQRTTILVLVELTTSNNGLTGLVSPAKMDMFGII